MTSDCTNSSAQADLQKKQLEWLIEQAINGQHNTQSYISAYQSVYKLSTMGEIDFLINVLNNSVYKIIQLKNVQHRKELLCLLQDIYLYPNATWFPSHNILFEEVVTRNTQQLAMSQLSLVTRRRMY